MVDLCQDFISQALCEHLAMNGGVREKFRKRSA
jgi:hypothetical protein